LEALGAHEQALAVLARLEGKELAPPDLAERRARLEAARDAAQARAGARPPPAGVGPGLVDPLALLGTQVGPCDLVRFVGQGSFAWVFEARHVSLQRTAAVKVLRPALAGGAAAERFLREGRALAGLESPHLVEVYDMGQERGLSYLALEL